MKGLTTLIRLHKRNLDDLRRQMVILENEETQLQQAVVTLQQELESEIKLAAAKPEMSSFFGEFAKRIRNRQEKIRQEIKEVETKIRKLNDEIAEEFTELKKFEIALENAKNRAKSEENRKETLMLDEIAAQQYQKKR
jgi:flagellar export protein FliJ